MAKTSLRLVAPDSELRTVTLCRHSNQNMGRDREHLTEHEVERLASSGMIGFAAALYARAPGETY
jgi:hypothetical protein